MKKSAKKENVSNVWRWVAVAPVICVTWVVAFIVGAYIESFLYMNELWAHWGMAFIIIDTLVLPSVAIFFVTRWIAPKYKNIMAIAAVVLCILWGLLLLYGLAHSY